MEKFFYELPVTSAIADTALAFGKSNEVWHLYYNFALAFVTVCVG